MATFTTEKHRDVGILLLKFQYKCAFLQQEAPPTPLPEFTIAMSGNGKSSVVEKIREEKALEYPSHSNLELQWKSDVLEKGDRLCLAREEDPYKLSMPYFLLLWNTVDDRNQKNKGKGAAGENGDDERCEWWIPDILKKLYSVSEENPINTDASKKHGTLHFPSSIDLSLPPGTYKLYLLRNDARNNVRVTLGKTVSLAVLPGLNSVHTSFGTTPLIDVKPLFATLQVFSEEDRSVVADALNNRDGFYDQLYVDKVTLEQEIEVTEREIKASEAVVNKFKEKKEGRDAKQKIATLQNVLKDLLARKEEIVKSEVLSLEKSKAGTDASKLSQSGAPGAQHAHTVFWSSQEVVLSYRFSGGAPSPQDRIVFLPADVVRVSDLLRSTILGKLQGNDSEHVAAIRETMERELVKVEQVFAWKFTLRSLYKLIKRKLKPYFGCGSGNSSKDKSDIYKAITGATDGSFVWDECMSAYKSAPPIARSNFTVIIRDLLDEIGARKAHLGLKKSAPRKADSRLAKANALMKLGLEIPVLVPGEMTNSAGLAAARGSNNVIVGECKASLGNRFRQGGFYVAKYVRRALESQDDENILETAGEICRFGPFYIEPALFSYSPTQMYLFIAKSIVKAAKSDECILFLKVAGHGLVSFLKYFLAVVSLSFNISVLAGNFSVDLTQIRHILDSFNQKLSSYFGPAEVVLEAIYAFFNGCIQDLMEHLNLIEVAGECVTGFFLLPIFALLFAATFVVYIVVQEDLLLKIQKIHTYLPINPGKTLLGFLEQVGALLVIPLYLTIKSCVLFISGHWSAFYHRLGSGEGLAAFQLYSTSHGICGSDELSKANYGVGIVALVLIVFFLFISLPLLLLDLFSRVPLSELEEREKLKDLAHSFDRKSIKAAIHSNATLTECPTCCPRPWKFQAFYDDYMQLPFRDLLQKYGILGLFLVFIYIYIILMGQSMLRSLGVLIGWRGRAWYMYKNVRSRPYSKWQFYDRFCLRFNFAWKVQYIKDKMVMPFVNLAMVTMGLWGETQWKEYNVEERANDCYLMEPSGEIKQLQMMSLHGKIVSLFWLCIPKTMVLAYLAEVLNRGPAFSYFLIRQFLQADIPESEREKDPVWRFGSILKFAGEEDVVYLTDTRFYSTVLKWGSSIVEIVSLLSVYPEGHQNRTFLFGIALISTAVAPFLEFNQQVIKAYVDYMETAENFASSNSCISKLREGKDAFDASKDALDGTPRVGINLRAAARRNRNGVISNPGTTNGVQSTAPNGTKEGQHAAPTSVVAVPAQSSTGIAAAVPAAGASGMIRVGGDDDWSGEAELGEVVEDNEDNMKVAENAVEEDGVAVALAAAGMVKPKKQLILLNAMPEISYVVLTDALDEGEGEITLNWQINARQRFHALDAIGMFPARAPGDVRIRTMEDCICYRLLKRRDAQKFGWKPEKRSDEDFERETILLQAKSLRDITEKNIKEIMNVPLSSIEDEQARQDKYAEKEEMLRKADDTMGTMMNSSKLKPYKKKMSDILEEEVLEKNLHNVSRRSTRMLTNAALGAEEAAKRARKVVTGQVKFRPANSSVKESDPEFETFVYGNNAGIYQSKYGLQRYEFCYLRHADVEAKIVGLKTEKEKVGGSKVSPASEQSQHYEILDRFCSNPISIGTFNIFMNLTCDIPLVGANEVVNLSWIIYGVPYRILSNSKSRNCIGFYKVEDTGACTKIEIIPTSAYLEVGESEPCPGRMTVTAPKEPGVYEIRFLFNFFKKAQLHRQCQVFGDLEDQMQQLRIRSFFEKRSLTEEIQKFAAREPKPWGIARMNTYAWLKSMLLSTLREPVAKSVMESTSEYGAFLYGRLKSKMNEGLKCKSPIYQRRIRQMIGPLYLNGFMEVLQVALASNSQMNDQLASITFISPTEDDIKHEGLNPFRDALLLLKDDELLLYGTSSFHHQARNYLKRQSLCGYHDFIDDIVLNQAQLLQTLDQVMKNVSSSCVTLYESAIVKAVEAMMGEAEAMSLGNVLQGINAILTDLCRNHIQSMVRAFVETDCRTGMRKLKAPIGTLERLQALRRGFVHMEDLMVDVENYGPTPRDGGFVPVTRQHIAIRRWIKPRLERKITIILRQRHARLLSNYSSLLWQMRHVCCIRTPSLVGNPFPNHRPGKTQSALYFLAETGTFNKAEAKQPKGRFAVTSEENLADEQLRENG
uniref:Uncharacterized protein n=1 Tax=Globisporangium ultimum (strain ATCC 200006 / CBS 805.95 / DAOM BR144) TaxID=431595 RepID=K3WK55_GLOUD